MSKKYVTKKISKNTYRLRTANNQTNYNLMENQVCFDNGLCYNGDWLYENTPIDEIEASHILGYQSPADIESFKNELDKDIFEGEDFLNFDYLHTDGMHADSCDCVSCSKEHVGDIDDIESVDEEDDNAINIFKDVDNDDNADMDDNDDIDMDDADADDSDDLFAEVDEEEDFLK